MDIIKEKDIHKSEIIYELPRDTPARYLTGALFLFAAYGCALTERRTESGMYIYTAVSLTSGKKKILSQRKSRLSESGYSDMAAKISALPFHGSGRLNIDNPPGESIKDSELMKSMSNIFNEILPQYGYAVRNKQIELAEHILSIIGKRVITLAESEVGTGKTHAYLIAAALAKRGRLNDFWIRGNYPRQSWAELAHMPVVISTSSIALQNAIFKDYIPELSRILMRHGIIRTPLTAAVRKGRRHYVCERRLLRYYKTTDTNTKILLDSLLGFNSPFDLNAIESLSPNMKRAICVLGKCENDCPHIAKCRYINHMERINNPKIDFQITNHNYFIADTLHRAKGMKPLLPHYQLVILDEAHKFLAAVRSMYGSELAGDEFQELAEDIHIFTSAKSKESASIYRLAKQMTEQWANLFQRLNDNIPNPENADDDREQFPTVMDENVHSHLEKLSRITGDLTMAIKNSRNRPFHKDHQTRVIHSLEKISERIEGLCQYSRLIYWLEKRTEGKMETDTLCATPKDLNERLYRDLWSKGIPIILTSGTLSAAGDFSRIKETLGLDILPKLPRQMLFKTALPSPFDHKNNTLLYISENTPFPNNKEKEYICAVADEIQRLVMASYGHAAVLFTSYNAMGQVHAILKNRRLPFPLFRLERGGVQAIEHFKRSHNEILLASGALWEGIDIPGDTLSMLIIVKLPFAVPDPIGDYERSLCGSMELYKAHCIVPDMLVKLKQGAGRLIRTESDTGVVAILDSRVSTYGFYRTYVLTALPPCRVTSEITDVHRFIRNKKPKTYFEQFGVLIS